MQVNDEYMVLNAVHHEVQTSLHVMLWYTGMILSALLQTLHAVNFTPFVAISLVGLNAIVPTYFLLCCRRPLASLNYVRSQIFCNTLCTPHASQVQPPSADFRCGP